MITPIYLDHNATTPTPPEVWEAMRPYLTDVFGNPSSAHAAGRQARRALEGAREQVAALLGASPDEVVFTSGATEANNLALFGLAGDPPAHLLGSEIEHPCVVEPLRQLAARGFEVEWLPVSGEGLVSPEDVAGRLRPETRLVSVMLVNHETGAIQPVREISERVREAGSSKVLFHCDAAQAAGKIPVRFRDLGVDALTVSGHKFGAPKGVGALLLKRDRKLRPLFLGGHQQQDRRPGTEPVALAVGMAAALGLAHEDMKERYAHAERLRRRLLDGLREGCPPVVVNGPADPARRSPYALNVSFPGCRADLLLMKLDLAGVACSTGSACSSGSLLPSPVLRAMGVPDDVLRSAVRLSFGPGLNEADIDEAARRVVGVVRRLRAGGEDDKAGTSEPPGLPRR
ncbi:MAG TPA: cysteine desulfurase family protein [Gemmataceae bacterium]